LQIELDNFTDDVAAAQLNGKLGSEDGRSGIVGGPGLVDGHIVRLKESLSTWMSQKAGSTALRLEGTPPLPIFPNILKVVDEVGNPELNEAVSLLKQRRALTEKDLSVFGVAIPGETALVVGPISMLLGLVYLLEHIRHVRRLWCEPYENALAFPWIAIFPGRLPVLLTHVSIFGLTSAAMLGLLFRSFDSLISIAHSLGSARAWSSPA
jgi:hypothetical protein